MTLTDEQRAAVRREGQDVCVVAGPGSGKTRVLVERFCWRVAGGYSPLRILAVTFTEKAATEIKQRLARDLKDREELRAQIERAHVSTVHGFCARLLREHAIEAGLDPQFEVLEAAEADAELQAAAEETLDRLFAERPAEVRALLEAADFSDFHGSLAGAYNAIRLRAPGEAPAPPGMPIFPAAFRALGAALEFILAARPRDWSGAQMEWLEGVQDWARGALALPAEATLAHFRVFGEFHCDLRRLKRNNAVYEEVKEVKEVLLPEAREALATDYYAPQRELLWEAIKRLGSAYRARKLALNALDFADLEERAIALLRDNPRVRERVRDSFDEVLMDEFQDTNPLQAALIELVRRPGRFFAVGDINQSIYGFRHADPEVFRRYRDQVVAQGQVVDRLTENHRSRAEILRAAADILCDAPGLEPVEMKAKREFAEKAGPSVEAIAALAENSEEAAALEAQWVARRIRELAAERAGRFADIAVLVRNVNALPAFEQAFQEFGVPYLVARGKQFYETQEVSDLVGWLRVLVNPLDEISLAAVLRSPLVGARDETLLRWREHGKPEELRGFWERLAGQRAERDEVAPDRLLARAIFEAGYESGLSGRARANVRKFLAQVREWYARRPRPLARLVEELEWRRAAGPDEPTAPPEDSANAVRVMTIHGAKGLEFPVVFVAALHKGVDPRLPPLAYSPAAGLVAHWRDPVTGKGVKDRPLARYAEELSRREEEEENRLFYVAMTRAEDHLVLSYATTDRGPKKWAAKLDGRMGVRQESAPPEPLAAEAAPAEQREVELLPRPALTGQHDAAVAVTSVGLFEDCPRRYFLARYLGWEQPGRAWRPARAEPEERDEIEADEFGRQVHDLLAGVEVEEAGPEARALAARFQASALGRRAAAASRLEREFDFLMELEELLLHGRIDLWFEEGGRAVLVDYKTDEVTAAEGAARATHYTLQLQLYALALERLTGRLPEEAFIYLLRPDVAVPIALDPESLQRAREALRALREAQSELDFPLRLGPQCRQCPYYRGLCPA